MRALVTGANGLLGSRLTRALRDAGHTVGATGRGAWRSPGLVGVQYTSADLGDPGALAAVVRASSPEVVFHTAALTDVDACEREPDRAYTVHVESVASLARACRETGAHLVHVSTDYVFDGEDGPYAEDAACHPRGTYATTKHLSEQVVRLLAGRWSIARTAVVYGWPAASRNNFGAWLVGALSVGTSVRLFRDQWVSPTLALDLADMLVELGSRRLEGVWHLAGGTVVSRVAFAEALCTRFGFDPSPVQPIVRADLGLASPRPRHSGLRVDKARAALAAGPRDLEAALDRFHAEWLAARAGTP